MMHRLKIKEEYLDNLVSGLKKVEIRLNDRDYQKGDLLLFKDYRNAEVIEYQFQISHIHSGLGMERNYIALSITKI